jgi:hypothetical protein
MPVPGIHDTDSAAEVDQPVSVCIGDKGALCVHHGNRCHRRHSSGYRAGAPRKQSPTGGAGDLGLQVNHAGHRSSGLN